jgi:CMP-N-acetylneuraminic acid synthetase
MPNVYALQTARAGSKSVKSKNTMLFDDKPLFQHPVEKALQSKLIKRVYISTDIYLIKRNSDNLPYWVISRPDELAGDDSSHHDVMIHGINEIEKQTQETVDILVVLLGNSLGAEGKELDKAIQFLVDNPGYDSIQSVSEFNMFNPFRAFTVENDLLKTYMDQQVISTGTKIDNVNDKNSAGDIYFANGSFFICRREILMKKEGFLPFPWLGYKIKPWIQEVTMEIDAYWQSSVLRSQCE